MRLEELVYERDGVAYVCYHPLIDAVVGRAPSEADACLDLTLALINYEEELTLREDRLTLIEDSLNDDEQSELRLTRELIELILPESGLE
jgi:hypothetical protein